MYKIECSTDNPIVRLIIQGQITVNDITQIAHEIYGGSSTDPILLLIDGSEMNCDIDFIDFNNLIDLAKMYVREDKVVYEAIIAQTPENYVLFTFYGDIISRDNHHYKIFSTEKAALDWFSVIRV